MLCNAIPAKTSQLKNKERGCFRNDMGEKKKKRHLILKCRQNAKVWRTSPTTLHQSAKFACLGWWVLTSVIQRAEKKKTETWKSSISWWMRIPATYIVISLRRVEFQSTNIQTIKLYVLLLFFRGPSWREWIKNIFGSLAKGFRILGNLRCLGRLSWNILVWSIVSGWVRSNHKCTFCMHARHMKLHVFRGGVCFNWGIFNPRFLYMFHHISSRVH